MDKVKQLSEAIIADGLNPKLYSQRCTAYLEVQEYVKALEDAKVLVRMLPDAPMGYLKAARCYRMLRRWKAAQKMLDVATEMSDEESTLRAIRSETKKLQLAEQQPLPCFIASLPEELFIEALSYLSTSDIFHASQVSQRWRTVTHSRRELWDSMVLLLNSGSDKYLRQLDEKLAFYLERLDGTSLKHLTIGLLSLPDTYPTAYKKPMTAYKDALIDKFTTNGMLSSLVSLWTVNLYREDNLITLLQSTKRTVRHYKYTLCGNVPLPPMIHPAMIIRSCPNLVSLDISDRVYQADAFAQRRDQYSPVVPKMISSRGILQSRPVASLRSLCVQSQQALAYSIPLLEESSTYDKLEHLTVNGRTPFSTTHALPNLRTLVVASNVALGSTVETRKLRKLERLEILKGVETINVLDLLQITDSPRLRAFSLGRGLMTGVAFSDFILRHPSLESLQIHNATVPSLARNLCHLPNLQRLSLRQSDLSIDILHQATIHLPKLRYLDVSDCSNVQSGPLLRLVKAKNGQLEELGIEGCRDLQKEAVDWLKANVKVVRWTGWRDKNEVRGWNIR